MRRVVLFAALAALAGAGCRDQGPAAGELSVRLGAPRPFDRALLLEVTGRSSGVTAPSGSSYRVFGRTSSDGDTAYVVVIAPAGSGLAAGEVARLRVDDVQQASGYAARVLDAATSAYAIGDTSGVTLSVGRP